MYSTKDPILEIFVGSNCNWISRNPSSFHMNNAMYAIDVPCSENKNGWKTLFVLRGEDDAIFAAKQFSTLEKYGKVASSVHMGTDERKIFICGKEPNK